jgi:hypothetical protein
MMKGGIRVGMKHQKQQRLIRLDGGTINNQLGAAVLMECRTTAVMKTKSEDIHIQ